MREKSLCQIATIVCLVVIIYVRHWLRLPGLGNNNEELGLPQRLSGGIQFRFRNLFHGKISGNCNFIC